ncbi:MAG: 30S ribosomal protein S6, partial [Proteobacteria bacterium]|nr:30S ribosomal protein S6 [Pseudomonadota bacterium]
MSLYESTFIIRHDMSTQQVEQLAESFSDIIKNNGGEVTKTEHWGLKTLAYRIKKNRKGHYVFFNVDAPSAAVQEHERNLRLSEDVLRYLTVRVDELDPEPSPMMQARASRDERSRRGGRPRDDAGSGDKASSDKESGDKKS